MVKAIVELSSGVSIEIEVSGVTRLIDVLNLLELNTKEVFIFCGRWNGEIGTPLLDFNRNFIDYNMWFPTDKTYNPSIVILDTKMNSEDKYKYDYYKSLGY